MQELFTTHKPDEKTLFPVECQLCSIDLVRLFLAVVSTTLVAQGIEMNTTVLVYTLAAVAGFIVVMLAMLIVAIAAIRNKGRKQQQGKKGIYNCSFATLFEYVI